MNDLILTAISTAIWLSVALLPMRSTSSLMPNAPRRTLPRPTSLRRKLPMRPEMLCA